MGSDLKEIYYVRKTGDEVFHDITELFHGVRVLKMDGFLTRGKPINIFTQQWVGEQEEDFLITKDDGNDTPVVVRENVDIELTFIVKRKYAPHNIDVQAVHDEFIDYMTGSDIWLGTEYMGGKCVHCVCLKEYAPTVAKLCRGDDSWIMGTLTLHALDSPQPTQ